jgi:nuclear GTP-binding protein
MMMAQVLDARDPMLTQVLDARDPMMTQVLDARDPMGTRCFHLERHIRKHLRHKHLILLLNKCDLVSALTDDSWLWYGVGLHEGLLMHVGG